MQVYPKSRTRSHAPGTSCTGQNCTAKTALSVFRHTRALGQVRYIVHVGSKHAKPHSQQRPLQLYRPLQLQTDVTSLAFDLAQYDEEHSHENKKKKREREREEYILQYTRAHQTAGYRCTDVVPTRVEEQAQWARIVL
eukprot:2216227-Rhodomonas_salina.1